MEVSEAAAEAEAVARESEEAPEAAAEAEAVARESEEALEAAAEAEAAARESEETLEAAEAESAARESEEPPENVNAGERPTTQVERAFPHLWRDLSSHSRPGVPRRLQLSLRRFIRDQDVAWMLCDLSFLKTHTVRLVDCGEARQVNAYTLSYQSGYFKRLFTYAQSTTIDIELGWLSPIAPGIVAAIDTLDLAGCHTEVTDATCLLLYMTADFLQCEQLRQRCLEFIRRRLPENSRMALDIWRAVHPFHLPELAREALGPLLRGFQEVRLTEEFLDLRPLPMVKLLDHRMLNCSSELQVLDTVIQWTQRPCRQLCPSPEQRRRTMQRLLRCIRTGLLTPEQLRAAAALNLPPAVTECDEFLRRLAGSTSESDGATLRSSQPRMPHQVVLLLSCSVQIPVDTTRERGPLAACHIYDPRADAWSRGRTPEGRPVVSEAHDPRLAQAPVRTTEVGRISRTCCVAAGDRVYLVGGHWYGVPHRAVFCYDRRRHSLGWNFASFMTKDRCDHCCAVVGGFLYAVGGLPRELRKPLASVERMSLPQLSAAPEDEKDGGDGDDSFGVGGGFWAPVDSLLKPRSDAAATNYRGRLLVVGGFDGSQHLDSAEIYCPTNGTWTLVSGCMSQRRSGLGLVVLGDAAYALCGRNASGWRRSIERWEEGRGGWRAHCKITTHRSSFGWAAIDSRIYLFGGVNAAGPVASTEWADPLQQPPVYGIGQPVPQQSEILTACLLDVDLGPD